MAASEERLSPWLDVVGDLLRQRLTVFPHSTLVRQFAATFEAEPSWNWVNADGTFGFELLHPPSNWPPTAELEYWRAGGMQRHPLIKWYGTARDGDAQTIGRVPLTVADREDRGIVRSQLRPVGLDEQLSIPYRFTSGSHKTFVLARTGEDFSDEDVELARLIQPLFMLLDRQIAVLGAQPDTTRLCQTTTGLTGREMAVVQLLAEGHTAMAIARRLGSSPRTVHKHLEHIYRKLGVRDRLTAVRSPQLRELLSTS